MLKSSFFALFEVDALSAISRLVMSMPLRQQVKIVPVEHWLEGIVMAAQNQDCAFHSVSFPLWGRGVFLGESGEYTRLS